MAQDKYNETTFDEILVFLRDHIPESAKAAELALTSFQACHRVLRLELEVREGRRAGWVSPRDAGRITAQRFLLLVELERLLGKLVRRAATGDHAVCAAVAADLVALTDRAALTDLGVGGGGGKVSRPGGGGFFFLFGDLEKGTDLEDPSYAEERQAAVDAAVASARVTAVGVRLACPLEMGQAGFDLRVGDAGAPTAQADWKRRGPQSDFINW
ncbi:hypothetical protein EW145_g8416 [Phellinidium pouzarii]|uniref:Uncharacterized protein n=1 Tax=Phellinidium pouzarii TaxID=167371 RepID=A0A4V3X993_9AGAM|nr:hypothetical protein EW145_g8416 [Phellinidium pouzarii]